MCPFVKIAEHKVLRLDHLHCIAVGFEELGWDIPRLDRRAGRAGRIVGAAAAGHATLVAAEDCGERCELDPASVQLHNDPTDAAL